MDLPAPLAWLVDEAGASPGPDRFLAELGGRLLADGLPLAGGALTLSVPHPIIPRPRRLGRGGAAARLDGPRSCGGALAPAPRQAACGPRRCSPPATPGSPASPGRCTPSGARC